jgi:hypothetical protein
MGKFDEVYSPKEPKKTVKKACIKKDMIFLDDTMNPEEMCTCSECNPEDSDDQLSSTLFDIYKSVDKNLVSGWASISIQQDGTLPLDWSGDVISPDVLETAAINFMEKYRTSGEMHIGDSVGIIVESIVFTPEKMEALGLPAGSLPIGWFITVKIMDNEVFAKVKSGQYKMFSIQGKAKRLKV